MAPSGPQPLAPTALRKEGPDRLVIEWNDGHNSVYTWRAPARTLSLRELP